MTINEIISKYGIEKLNTMTKYPSILTYHALGEKGMLKEELNPCSFPPDTPLFVTEKIDGTNTRIVIDCTGDYLIGSRENFLYAKGDRIGDPACGIVDVVKDIAEYACKKISIKKFNSIIVLYGESYGGVITVNSKQYTNSRKTGFRIFDVAEFPNISIEDILSMSIDKIASWREHDGQEFWPISNLKGISSSLGVDLVPYIEIVDKIPTTRKETFEWLQKHSETKAALDNTGKAEGVVVRTEYRSMIRKIRFEDYERTKKRGGF